MLALPQSVVRRGRRGHRLPRYSVFESNFSRRDVIAIVCISLSVCWFFSSACMSVSARAQSVSVAGQRPAREESARSRAAALSFVARPVDRALPDRQT
jgi:hypothetical protein